MALTIDTIISRLMSYRPQTVEAALVLCGLPLQHLNWGQFRHVFHILGSNLVLKFPIVDENYDDNRAHGAQEYHQYKRILHSKKKYLRMQPYMPKIHLFQKRSGITLMEKYQTTSYSRYKHQLRAMRDDLRPLISDISPHNSGIDRYGNLKMIDLGLACYEIESPDVKKTKQKAASTKNWGFNVKKAA